MNWVEVAFKLFSNRDKIFDIYKQIKPLIPQITKVAPKAADLIREIDPDSVNTPQTSFSVEWMQESLNKITDDIDLVVDGDYGEMTREAVRKFQEQNGLEPDGWAGIQTCVEIYKKMQELKEQK
jgi:peptidoglycan hydrolase-like protein with peptidoglycan-binding domain